MGGLGICAVPRQGSGDNAERVGSASKESPAVEDERSVWDSNCAEWREKIDEAIGVAADSEDSGRNASYTGTEKLGDRRDESDKGGLKDASAKSAASIGMESRPIVLCLKLTSQRQPLLT